MTCFLRIAMLAIVVQLGQHELCGNGTAAQTLDSSTYELLTKHNLKILHIGNYNYTYYLKFSKHERQNQEVRGQLIESEDIYKRRGKKKLYVVYSMEGEIVLYKTRRKTKLFTGFKDPFFTKKPLILSKFAVLKKAEKLRSLTIEEIRSMNLKKYEGSYIKLFIPE